jgi:hypothetical protein
MLTIWFRGIKSKPRSIIDFCMLMHVCLENPYAIIIPTINPHIVIENQHHVQKLHCASLRKTLVLMLTKQMFFFWKINDKEGAPIVGNR